MSRKIKLKTKPIGIDPVTHVDIDKSIDFRNEDIFVFFKINKNKFDLIMIKQTLHFFNEDKNLVAMEDWKLWMESIYNGKKVILLEEILLNYRVHTASISNRNSDIGYRKTLYLLSLLLLQREIPLRHYFFSTLFNLIKIIIKNLKRA